jgi:tripartite-type tricarboxylate transporter receptor subunit TctC
MMCAAQASLLKSSRMPPSEDGAKTMTRHFTAVALLTAISAAAPGPGVAFAQEPASSEVANFYRGKQMRMIIRSGPGGGFDLYSRLLARFIVKHIPGNPTIVAQNMPAGGGLAAVSFVGEVAPQDGTVLTMIGQSLPFDQALGYTPSFKQDLRTFHWIGNLSDSNVLTYTWHTRGINSMNDARSREVSLGSTGAGDVGSWLPSVYNKVLGTKFKIINGYQGFADVKLAMERGEIDGFGANPLASITSTQPQFIRDRLISILVQVGLRKEKELPDVPLLTELARTDDERKVLEFVSKAMSVGRPIGVGPGVPTARVEALRKAFDATLTDPEFIAEAKKSRMDIGPMDGVTVQRLINEVQGSSTELRTEVRALMPPR